MTTRRQAAASNGRIETLPLLLGPASYQLISIAASLGMTLLTLTISVS